MENKYVILMKDGRRFLHWSNKAPDEVEKNLREYFDDIDVITYRPATVPMGRP